MNETLQQFLARGGKISKIEAQKAPDVKHILPVRSTGSTDLIDLAGGAELFSEAAMAASKPVRKVKINKKPQGVKINADLIPPALLGLLTTLGVPSDAARQKQETVSEG